MAARKLFRESTSDPSNNRARDSIIDELPPEETEKMGYVWVKGTLSEEEEKEAAKFGSLPDIGTLPTNEISSCNIAKEKVHELIVPWDQWGEGPVQSDRTRGPTEDFKLYIPSFIRQMHSLFSRPPELIRKDTASVQHILEQMPLALADRPSYIQNASRFLDLTSRPVEQNGESPTPSVELHKDPEEKEQVEVSPAPVELEQNGDSSKLRIEEPTAPSSSEQEERADLTKYRDLHAMYADPEIESEETEKPPVQLKPLSRGIKMSGNEPFIREYILRKVKELEHKLRIVNSDISGSKERYGQLQHQLYEMEILKLVEKISKADTPSETDVAKLEYLTDQLKIAQGKKPGELQ